MPKNIVKFWFFLLVFSIVSVSNTFAFHKENSIITRISTEWDGDPKTKIEYEKKAKQDWCALKSSAKKIKGEPLIDEDTGLQKVDENNKKIFKEDTFEMELEGYHLKEPQKTNGKLLPTLSKLNLELIGIN